MFDLKTWDGFSKLPKEGLDYLLNTTALNKKMADRKDNPYRWRVGSFQVPKDITQDMLEKVSQEACKKFVQTMEKQGWKLESKLQVFGPFPAYDLLYRVILLDKDELRVRGIFSTEPKPIRLELPSTSVRQDTKQKADLIEVARGEGMRPVPRHKRPQK